MSRDKYEEYEAKIILEKYSKRYKKLKLSDRPDIYDDEKSIGIEVVYGNEEDKMKNVSIWLKNASKENSFEIYCDNCLEYHFDSSDLDILNPIIESFENKVEKMQEYQEFKKYDLFIHTNIGVYEEHVNMLIDIFNEKNKLNRKFDYVYIYSQNDLIEIDLKNKKYFIQEVEGIKL